VFFAISCSQSTYIPLLHYAQNSKERQLYRQKLYSHGGHDPKDGMSAQGDGEYAEALDNYDEALRLEENPYDRSYILYNMGLIHASNGDHNKALDLYNQAVELNARLCQALNNIAVIYHFQGERAQEDGDMDGAEELFNQAAAYWKQAIKIAPNNYIEAQNWLKTTGRSTVEVFF
jgi:tetratricopeptide (TPR) repeat protein